MRERCVASIDQWVTHQLAPAIARGESIDVNQMSLELTIHVISSAGLAVHLTDAQVAQVLHDVDACMCEYGRKRTYNPLRFTIAWALADAREAARAAHRLAAFSQSLLEQYRALAPPARERHERSLIGMIDANRGYRSDAERCADITIFLVAGHDTTGYQLAWTLCELAAHPAEQAALRAALRAAPEPATCAELARTIKESHSLNPATAMGSFRTVAREFEAADGARIPAGSIVAMPTFCMHRSAAVYSQPDEFVPARWAASATEPASALPGEQPHQPPSSELLLPFSLGKRNCVGQALASMELQTVLALLLADYEFSVDKGWTADYFLTRKPRGARLFARRAAA
jgi:cytochrome P450